MKRIRARNATPLDLIGLISLLDTCPGGVGGLDHCILLQLTLGRLGKLHGKA